MRVMAIDYGERRTGLALSDLTGTLTGETLVVHSGKASEVCERIATLALERQVTELVLGYPKNMNATLGPRAEKTEAFANLLRAATNLPVTLWDERLTTVDAHRILSDAGRSGKKRKERVDAVAASLILEGYLRKRELRG